MTDRAALPGIHAHGLLSARALCTLHGVASDALLRDNRMGWQQAGPAMLRTQGMRDAVLEPRLDPAIPCKAWRWFINGFVFLFPTESAARRFRASEPGRDQVILRVATDHILAQTALFSSRYNNGFADRRPIAEARRRTWSDYQHVADWPGTPVAELGALHAIPPHIEFELCAPG